MTQGGEKCCLPPPHAVCRCTAGLAESSAPASPQLQHRTDWSSATSRHYEIPRHTALTFTAGQRLALAAKLVKPAPAWHRQQRDAGSPWSSPASTSCLCTMPRTATGTKGTCLLCWHWSRDIALPRLPPLPRGGRTAALSGCLQKERMQFSIWKEEGLCLVSNSSDGHIRIWGNKLNALPSLGVPECCQVRDGDPPNICSQLPKVCLRHK